MISLDDVRRAVNVPDFDFATAHARMAPVGRRMLPPDGVAPRQAGVLILLFPENNTLHVVLTRRTDTLRG
ncbi:MAG: hypothetical protein K8I30_10265, partial [Anaerolineae bacterium]|nr:hypothetical protein [Anaerolineae bacterium]